MIEIGDRARDMITKYQGIVIARAYYMYGCSRLYILPEELSEGKVPDGNWFDDQRVELIDERIMPATEADTKRFKLGARVRDRITKYEGIITGLTIHLSGQVEVSVDPEKIKDNKIEEAIWLMGDRIDILEEIKIPISEHTVSTSGGPQRDRHIK